MKSDSSGRLSGAPVRARQPGRAEVAYEASDRAPDFRFVFTPADGAVVPWGFLGGDRLAGLVQEPGDGAIGDVVALDADHAIASFARVDDAFRERAEAELRRWAQVDRWLLEIEPGLRPLALLPGWNPTIGDGRPPVPDAGRAGQQMTTRGGSPSVGSSSPVVRAARRGGSHRTGSSAASAAASQEARSWKATTARSNT